MIYQAFNIFTRKSYIGRTVKTLQQRKVGHKYGAFNKNGNGYNCKFYRAIRKYGFNSFVWFILDEQKILHHAGEIFLEYFYADKYNTVINGYNSVMPSPFGVYGCLYHSKETRERISKANMGKSKTQAHKQKLREANLGKTHTAASKQKMSMSRMGKSFHSKEQIKKLIEYSKNRIKSPEERKKLSKALKGRLSWNKGKTMKELKPNWINPRKGVPTHCIPVNSKKIICNETGQVFSTIKEAAEQFNISRRSIQRILSGSIQKVKNLSFKLHEETTDWT